MSSGCGSVGRAVASDTRGLQFKSSHRQTLYYLNTFKRQQLRKRGQEWPFYFKKTTIYFLREIATQKSRHWNKKLPNFV